MLTKYLLALITHPLLIASGAAVLIAEVLNTETDREVALLGGFFMIGVLPNLLIQVWSYWVAKEDFEPNEQVFAYEIGGNTHVGAAASKSYKDAVTDQAHLERWYLFWFALLAVVYGAELLNHQGWMVVAMAYAIYHGINLLVIKYFYTINPRIGEVVFWSTVLININPNFAFTYLLLLPLIWWHPGNRKLDFVALNWSIGIALFSALLTWIS